MKRSLRSFLVLLAVVSLACGLAAAAWCSEVSEGQVVMVQEWTLYIRTANGLPLSFVPYWVKEGTAWVSARPVRTMLPALESGEVVKVTWTLDTREGCRRIDGIQVISPLEGTTKGTVVSSSATQLVIRPKDEPGTVTLNPRIVKIGEKWMPDPEISSKLRSLKPKDRVTVRWAWDNEGHKRIASLTPSW